MCSKVNVTTEEGASLQSPPYAHASPPFRGGVIPRMTGITDISKLPGLDQALFAQLDSMKMYQENPFLRLAANCHIHNLNLHIYI